MELKLEKLKSKNSPPSLDLNFKKGGEIDSEENYLELKAKQPFNKSLRKTENDEELKEGRYYDVYFKAWDLDREEISKRLDKRGIDYKWFGKKVFMFEISYAEAMKAKEVSGANDSIFHIADIYVEKTNENGRIHKSTHKEFANLEKDLEEYWETPRPPLKETIKSKMQDIYKEHGYKHHDWKLFMAKGGTIDTTIIKKIQRLAKDLVYNLTVKEVAEMNDLDDEEFVTDKHREDLIKDETSRMIEEYKKDEEQFNKDYFAEEIIPQYIVLTIDHVGGKAFEEKTFDDFDEAKEYAKKEAAQYSETVKPSKTEHEKWIEFTTDVDFYTMVSKNKTKKRWLGEKMKEGGKIQDPDNQPDITTLQNLNEKAVEYIPESDMCETLDTVVPYSMRYEMRKAIETVDRRVNGVDEYVAKKLGYCANGCSIEEYKVGMTDLCDAFSAEQVDAIAVIIYNIEQRGQGCIIGDQTGIGKGRIAAGIIRYTLNIGKIPIFLTEKSYLFTDIYRDLIDIRSDEAVILEEYTGDIDRLELDIDEEGFGESAKPDYIKNKNYKKDIKKRKRVVPFIINGRSQKTHVKSPYGHILYKGLPKKATDKILKSKRLPKEYDCILLTYSQIARESATEKRDFMMEIARDNVIIMDESHNASGDSQTGKYLRKVLEKTFGVVFLSATFAKRPDNMPIYAGKTSLSDANLSNDQLIGAITVGGVALQEVISSQLVLEGQMLRREKAFDGIAVNYIYLDSTQDEVGKPSLNKEKEHRAISDAATDIMRDIIDFQMNHVRPQLKRMDEEMKEEYKEVVERKGTRELGIKSTPLFSQIFNFIDQLLFAIKAESVADVAIAKLEEGRKAEDRVETGKSVIIAFAKTMESFLNNMTNEKGNRVEVGDIVNTDFTEIFKSRLHSVLKYTVKNPDGTSTKEILPIEELDYDAREEYGRIVKKIKEASIGINFSPIDVLREKIEKAGFTTIELTGRSKILRLKEGEKGVVEPKPKKATTDAFRDFNNNKIDCILMNQSAATGASAHAIITKFVPREKVRKRVMIILQAELDINKEVQKRGRINRTGQILKPEYDYVFSAIPAEQRLSMMLQKKLKSLDANTTSNQKQSRKILDVVDFLDKYGNSLVEEYCRKNPLFNAMIGDPLKLEGKEEGEKSEVNNAAHIVSGRVALLSTEMQEEFYTEITESYLSEIEFLKQAGEYDLEVENVDLQAETISKEIVVVGKGGESAFGRHSILEKCEVNILKKPFKKKELDKLLKESLQQNGTSYTSEYLQKKMTKDYERFTERRLEEEKDSINQRYADLTQAIKEEERIKELKGEKKEQAIAERKNELDTHRDESLEKAERISENRKQNISRLFKEFTVGKVIGYPSLFDESTIKGVFLGFDINLNRANPYALSAIKLRFALSNSDKYLAVPASKTEIVDGIIGRTYSDIMTSEQDLILEEWDEIIKEYDKGRKMRYIVTGNILQAYGKDQFQSKLVSYTVKDGGIKKGILLPDTFDPAGSAMEGKKGVTITVPIIKALKLIKGLTSGNMISTTDGFTIMRRMTDDYELIVPLSKAKGGKFYMDEVILRLTEEGEFEKMGSSMKATLELKKIDNLVNYLQNEFNSNVELAPTAFDTIKDQFKIEDYKDEEIFIEGGGEEFIVEKLTRKDREVEEAKKEREFEKEQKTRKEEEQLEAKQEEKSKQLDIEKRKLKIKKKLIKLFGMLYYARRMAKGGVLGSSYKRNEKIHRIPKNIFVKSYTKAIKENGMDVHYSEFVNAPDIEGTAGGFWGKGVYMESKDIKEAAASAHSSAVWDAIQTNIKTVPKEVLKDYDLQEIDYQGNKMYLFEGDIFIVPDKTKIGTLKGKNDWELDRHSSYGTLYDYQLSNDKFELDIPEPKEKDFKTSKNYFYYQVNENPKIYRYVSQAIGGAIPFRGKGRWSGRATDLGVDLKEKLTDISIGNSAGYAMEVGDLKKVLKENFSDLKYKVKVINLIEPHYDIVVNWEDYLTGRKLAKGGEVKRKLKELEAKKRDFMENPEKYIDIETDNEGQFTEESKDMYEDYLESLNEQIYELSRMAKGGEVKTYYSSSSHKFPFSELVEIEVEERGNYEMDEIDNWRKKYGIDNKDMVIWVTTNDRIAHSFNFGAEERDEVEKASDEELKALYEELEGYETDPEDHINIYSSDEGFIIPESDDGDEGFVFVFKTMAKGGEVERVEQELMQAMSSYDFEDEEQQWEMIETWLRENYPDNEELIVKIETKFRMGKMARGGRVAKWRYEIFDDGEWKKATKKEFREWYDEFGSTVMDKYGKTHKKGEISFEEVEDIYNPQGIGIAHKTKVIAKGGEVERQNLESALGYIIAELREWNPDSEAAQELENIQASNPTDKQLIDALKFGRDELRQWNPDSEAADEVDAVLLGAKMAQGGSITARRFTENDYNRLINDDEFYSIHEGNYKSIRSETFDTEVGKYYPKEEKLTPVKSRKLDNPLVKWLQQNAYVSSDEYIKLEQGGEINTVYDAKMAEGFKHIKSRRKIGEIIQKHAPNMWERLKKEKATDVIVGAYVKPDKDGYKTIYVYEKEDDVDAPVWKIHPVMEYMEKGGKLSFNEKEHKKMFEGRAEHHRLEFARGLFPKKSETEVKEYLKKLNVSHGKKKTETKEQGGLVDKWVDYGKKHLIGNKITLVRYMDNDEVKVFDWNYRPLVIQFDDKSLIFPSSDEEGNDAGSLYGRTGKGELLVFPVLRGDDLSMERKWTKYANKYLLGRTVRGIEYMDDKWKDDMGWYKKSLVIKLDNGTKIFPSQDDEGNDAGALFGQDKDGHDLTFPTLAKGGEIKKRPEKGTPEWHQVQIAKKTVNIPEPIAAVMGGMTPKEAKGLLEEYGIKYQFGGKMNGKEKWEMIVEGDGIDKKFKTYQDAVKFLIGLSSKKQEDVVFTAQRFEKQNGNWIGKELVDIKLEGEKWHELKN